MKVGTTELILILVVALVVFGPSKLPELGKLAGQAVGSFKKYLNTFEGEWDEGAQKGGASKVSEEKAEPETSKEEVEAVEAETMQEGREG